MAYDGNELTDLYNHQTMADDFCKRHGAPYILTLGLPKTQESSDILADIGKECIRTGGLDTEIVGYKKNLYLIAAFEQGCVPKGLYTYCDRLNMDGLHVGIATYEPKPLTQKISRFFKDLIQDPAPEWSLELDPETQLPKVKSELKL